jgi:hypothetical protein
MHANYLRINAYCICTIRSNGYGLHDSHHRINRFPTADCPPKDIEFAGNASQCHTDWNVALFA